jgi:alkylated DNA repair dioxygenase AlkB
VVSLDATFSRLQRFWLDAASWVDVVPGWVSGSAALFQQLVETRAWSQRTRWMYERQVLEPRLTASWSAARGDPLSPPVLEEMRATLSARYGVELDSLGFNLYRTGEDSVAWHRDKIDRRIEEPVVGLVSLGARRRILLRPRGGGSSHGFPLGHGDLLVTGGRTQRDWEHSVPKVAHAAPRLSLAFRHGMDARAYGLAPAPDHAP